MQGSQRCLRRAFFGRRPKSNGQRRYNVAFVLPRRLRPVLDASRLRERAAQRLSSHGPVPGWCGSRDTVCPPSCPSTAACQAKGGHPVKCSSDVSPHPAASFTNPRLIFSHLRMKRDSRISSLWQRRVWSLLVTVSYVCWGGIPAVL